MAAHNQMDEAKEAIRCVKDRSHFERIATIPQLVKY